MIISNIPQSGGGDLMISKICGEWAGFTHYSGETMYFEFKDGAEKKQFELLNAGDKAEYIFNPPVPILDLVGGGVSMLCDGQEVFNNLNGASLSIAPNAAVAGTYIITLSVINARDPR